MKIEKVSKNMKLPDNENRHHLFSYQEIKFNLLQIYGQPITEEEHDIINKEVMKVWRKMPKYRIMKSLHSEIHNDICKECGRSSNNIKRRLQKQDKLLEEKQ